MSERGEGALWIVLVRGGFEWVHSMILWGIWEGWGGEIEKGGDDVREMSWVWVFWNRGGVNAKGENVSWKIGVPMVFVVGAESRTMGRKFICGSIEDESLLWEMKEKTYDTKDSRVIPHLSTNFARRHLTSQFGMGCGARACSMAVCATGRCCCCNISKNTLLANPKKPSLLAPNIIKDQK